ncbi:hypothetical protein [Endozoicomonas sp. SCSIO W0465]|uniref:hypothetical protein n=1 Tax=Endozoicomonas sp. SCSIO W0465 TaxID=2918516 RepID=UPI0020762F1E|nr:hypothetical protein [Endozoicomonas sp. SCSIO W0465]USE35276.1 hypothetical protein MJO57_24730 [Endozoicomonas sp. SCSIO W0465]
MSEDTSGSVTDEVIAASGTDGELLPFISDEFAEVAMEFEVLRDSSITSSGLSQFMKVVQAL